MFLPVNRSGSPSFAHTAARERQTVLGASPVEFISFSDAWHLAETAPPSKCGEMITRIGAKRYWQK